MPNGPKPAAAPFTQAEWDALSPYLAQAYFKAYATDAEKANALGESKSNPVNLPENLGIDQDGNLISASGNEAINVGIGNLFLMGGTVYRWNGTSITKATAAETKSYLAGGGTGINPGTGNNGTPGNGVNVGYAPQQWQDPRYWQLEYDKLTQQYAQMGLTADDARRQALTTLITSRNSLAASTANTSLSAAQQEAQFAANPRDAYAEAIYRNQVGGSTPFGDTNNAAFGTYGKALADKAASIFTPVNQDLNMERQYRDAIPLPDYLGNNAASQVSVPGTAPAASVAAPAAAPASTNGLQALMNQLNSFNPQQKADFQNYVTGGAAKATVPPPAPAYAMGTNRHRQIHVGDITGGGFGASFATGTGANPIQIGNLTRFGGQQPSSSEGGLNLNIHELAHIVGESGHVYASLGEGGYPEQVKITPTPSGKKAALAAEKAGKELSGTMKNAFDTGGTATVGPNGPSLDQLHDQFTQLLQRLGGQGGGSMTPFGGTRFLAGAPAAAIQADPYLKATTEGTYSMGPYGIDPAQLWSEVAKFTPNGVTRMPQVNFGA